ncbi:MAG: prephenate dehydrogenase [Saprospiraceae bacterium]
MTITIIGLGLIGGSIALDLRKSGYGTRFVGVDINPEHGKKAIELGIVDETMDLIFGIQAADLVILAIPVNAMRFLVHPILDNLREDAILIDVGSTKSGICEAAKNHRNRGNFVACHPLAGTENTGPEAALYELFRGKVNVICEPDLSHKWAVEKIDRLFAETLKMRNTYMNPIEHDRHIAYVSHLSHISSFTLGLTVLEIEKDEKHIFNMASTGFASTVRLAKSSSKMWTPIFAENAQNVSTALQEYINQLQQFKDMIDNSEFEAIHERIEEANDIGRILDGIELKKIAFG